MTVPLSDRILAPAESMGGTAKRLLLGSAISSDPDPSEIPTANPGAPGPLAVPPASAFDQRMAEFYTRVDAVVASHSPVCRNRGLCCKFAAYGHRLYVTEPERQYFARGMATEWRPVTPDQADCPYHVGGVCTARTHRPMGCRVFFCDEAAQEWQGPVYERFLAELKTIGQEFDLPYAYREWLSALDDGLQGATGSLPATVRM